MQTDVQKLVSDHFKFICKLAQKAKRMYPRADIDDLIGQGSLGALRAAKRYDGCAVKFSTFAWKAIWGEMMEHVCRETERAKRTSSLDAAYGLATSGDDGGEFSTCFHNVLSANDPEPSFESDDQWRHLLRPLHKKARHIVLRVVRDGETKASVAREVGLSESMIAYTLIDAGEFLRKSTLAGHSLPDRIRTLAPCSDKRSKPVVNDAGEWHPSAVRASLSMGLSHSTVTSCLKRGVKAGGRMWRYATEDERPKQEVAA